jgi:hypothetical protein
MRMKKRRRGTRRLPIGRVGTRVACGGVAGEEAMVGLLDDGMEKLI